jgi:hypothetical protein
LALPIFPSQVLRWPGIAGARESTRITAADFVDDSTDFAAVVDFMATGDFGRGIIP